MTRIAALLLASLLPAGAAAAADPAAPPTMPTRDVDVIYTVQAGPPGAANLTQRSRFDITHGRVRIDTPTQGLYILVDEPGRQMQMVVPANRSVLVMPYDPGRLRGGLAAGYAQRLGNDTVAGLACTEWQTSDTASHPVAVCITPDGVILRARQGANTLALATRVAYGPVDPALFVIPPEYRREAAPQTRPAPGSSP